MHRISCMNCLQVATRMNRSSCVGAATSCLQQTTTVAALGVHDGRCRWHDHSCHLPTSHKRLQSNATYLAQTSSFVLIRANSSRSVIARPTATH